MNFCERFILLYFVALVKAMSLSLSFPITIGPPPQQTGSASDWNVPGTTVMQGDAICNSLLHTQSVNVNGDVTASGDITAANMGLSANVTVAGTLTTERLVVTNFVSQFRFIETENEYIKNKLVVDTELEAYSANAVYLTVANAISTSGNLYAANASFDSATAVNMGLSGTLSTQTLVANLGSITGNLVIQGTSTCLGQHGIYQVVHDSIFTANSTSVVPLSVVTSIPHLTLSNNTLTVNTPGLYCITVDHWRVNDYTNFGEPQYYITSFSSAYQITTNSAPLFGTLSVTRMLNRNDTITFRLVNPTPDKTLQVYAGTYGTNYHIACTGT